MAFLSLGPDASVADASGATALMSAAAQGRPELAFELLARGARHQDRDKEGRSALDFARQPRFGAASAPMAELVKRLEALRRSDREAREIQAQADAVDARLGKALREALRRGASVELDGLRLEAEGLLRLLEEPQAPSSRPRL